MSDPTLITFPSSFQWGTATAAYQIEGAATEHRVPSIWDRFSATPGKVHNGDTGAIACDHYHRMREDVQLIKRLNTSHYRFSIAWPRLQTWDDDLVASPNPHGIAFYNSLIDELLANDITPVVTLYHWDLPLPLQDGLSGWADPSATIAQKFADYAELAFASFGDRVTTWITLNEPWCSTYLAYETGEHAPGDTSSPGTAVYRAGHNLLLAHARAVDVYRKQFAKTQGGKIAITLNANWAMPKDPLDDECAAAAARAMEFELGWFAHPVYFGDYPECMRAAAGERLPTFSKEEQELLHGSSDFFGLNHYSTGMITRAMTPDERAGMPSYEKDRGVVMSGRPDWRVTDMGWAIVPSGFTALLKYIQRTYRPTGGIVVTENGLAVREETVDEARGSEERVRFYREYLTALHRAMQGRDAADVRGYFLWSLMDNFEWAFGYEKRFGLYFVDYDSLERFEKPAVAWYAGVTKSKSLEAAPGEKEEEEEAQQQNGKEGERKSEEVNN